MRAKKPTSVRKPTRAKKLTRARKPARVVRSARTRKAARVQTTTSVEKSPNASATSAASGSGAWALVLGAAGVVTVGLVIGLPSNVRTDVTLEPASRAALVLPAVSDAPEAAMGRPPRAPAGSAGARMTAAATGISSVTAPVPAPKTLPVVEPTQLPHHDAPVATAAAEPALVRSVEQTALVTVTGCLETDDERFRLNDTTGSDAPKSRSWKSGFLRKRPAPIDVLDASGVGLPGHVGERVALTGTLVDRNMHVRSLKRVAVSCE